MDDLLGVLPAVPTPFDAEGCFRPSAFEKLLDRVYAAGVHGVYVCGHTGEGLLQPVSQRKQVAETAVRCSPQGKSVIVHVGANQTADAVELARHARRCGAQAVSSLPPLGGYSFEEIKSYYRALGEASDVPVLVYYFPESFPALSSMDQVLELMELPNVAGLKFTDFNLFLLALLRARDLVVFNGRDEVFAAGLLMNASGGIGTFYSLIPELFLEVWYLGRRQLWEQARAVQTQINELIEIVLHFPLLPATKLLLAWSGLDCGPCLAPRSPLSREEQDRLRVLIEKSSLAERKFAGLQLA
jgi:N-acetylneuraminate lyase